MCAATVTAADFYPHTAGTDLRRGGGEGRTRAAASNRDHEHRGDVPRRKAVHVHATLDLRREREKVRRPRDGGAVRA